MTKISILLWIIFFMLLGCVLIVGPSIVDVDNSVKRPALEYQDTIEDIDWIEW